MKRIKRHRYAVYTLVILITACTNTPVKEKTLQDTTVINKKEQHKPPAHYGDTLTIDTPAAIFYSPDSLQLQQIKELTEERIFESQLHEYFFQMRNARMVLKKNWPAIAIIEAKNVRYLLFKKSNTDSAYIDLNNYDPYGLFLFNTKKNPHPADMMNIDSELPFYFEK